MINYGFTVANLILSELVTMTVTITDPNFNSCELD